jgi:hypothetical protein
MTPASRSHSILRHVIRGILSEDAGPGKSMELVRRLEALNRDLEAADVPLVAGVRIRGSGSSAEVTFAVRMPKVQGLSVVALPDDKDMDNDITNIGPPSVKDAARRAGPKLMMRVPYGSINFNRAKAATQGQCAGAWVVHSTENTTPGWGPLLYDLAMEYATANGGGLAPDRVEVSPDASAVWSKYGSSRGDVVPQQLDILSSFSDEDPETWGDQITPEDTSDDCEQDSAQYWGGGKRGAWKSSPLSRAYKKPDGVVTSTLEKLGLLWR